ncbi:ATP-binding cassette domain-containing protein [Lactococcus cremoris]|uniref:Teichoic acid export ATP-binding protein tagH n=2 Tax=Lactococcus lactis subsp. cremoris TaxID=1359 RepID=A0A084AEK6_LACLC|nr:ATP-binding cassette domain-containing protein [Lactococcus cremoris]KEY63735.1 Teichoic acid export ATP-binding protein tagH [Lactococcus cremoris subsp. cremoris GE214]KKW71337.1 daunorubicin resistance ABC transporter, ATP-binding protein [Lactococcus cremoris]TNU82398.1 ATP-binding cassette domain-containing protein [Lactococcus cremoris]
MTNNNNKKLKVKATNLTKRFEMLETTSNKMKTLFGLNRDKGQEFWALRNVSFEVHDGETIGIIGLNGSGKSTISTLISGTMTPTTGALEVNGDVSIIALGTGLIPNLTGRENIHVVGLMMGMTNKEIENKLDDIINFSELGPFIDQPLKTYSSGMKAKLSFSIAAYQDPDILIIDEVLSVGDGTFGQKSADKMFEFREQGKTILLISHDMLAIEKWCDKVLWLHYGEVKGYGSTEEILPQYINFVQWFIRLIPEEQDEYKEKVRREQLTYSVEILKDELEEEYGQKNSRSNREEVKEQLDFSKNNKLSVFIKMLLVVLALVFLAGGIFYTSNTSDVAALANPINFFQQHAFREKTEFSEKISNEVRSLSESEARKNRNKEKLQLKSITENQTTTTKSSKASKKSSSLKESSQSSPSSTEATTNYTIQAGDSLSVIADNLGTTVSEIQTLNPGLDAAALQPGAVIKVPETTTTTQGH